MRSSLTILILFVSSHITPSIDSGLCLEAFPAPVSHDLFSQEEVEAVARVVWAEARGEPEDGQVALIDAIRNRSKGDLVEATRTGMVSGKLDEKLVELVKATLRKEVSHGYSYWYNPDTATDEWWLEVTEDWPGEMIGRHWFMREP